MTVGAQSFPIPAGTFSTLGMPDRIVIQEQAPGTSARVMLVEIKSAKGVVSEHQQKFGDNWMALGGEWHVWRSADDVYDTFGFKIVEGRLKKR